MATTDPRVDAYVGRQKRWREETEGLRAILLEGPLTESLKWGKPCYAFEGGNVAIIQGFKDYCAVMFFKGALLKDPKGLLRAPGASQAGRQLRFASAGEITRRAPTIRAYLKEAIAVEKAGLRVVRKETSAYPVPEELQRRLDDDPALKRAFEALTPGRQRGYLFFFASAKQSKTREARIEKAVPRILAGKGLND
jgi:uncharacterized protein YdeI (YjbR/CyaY-like superfamily)